VLKALSSTEALSVNRARDVIATIAAATSTSAMDASDLVSFERRNLPNLVAMDTG
jgi:hypothetical protein